jgi:hypothetical protein
MQLQEGWQAWGIYTYVGYKLGYIYLHKLQMPTQAGVYTYVGKTQSATGVVPACECNRTTSVSRA